MFDALKKGYLADLVLENEVFKDLMSRDAKRLFIKISF